ncbi:MAG: GHKL domain-containing protein, partial [Deltaproteobacteria bacterium]|nr:GHKL domain-containing protein [Deltaproteobacteria bacterium]
MASGLVSGPTHGRGFRRIVVSLIWLVTVPSGVLLVLGILLLVFYDVAQLNLLFGILVLLLVGCLVTGAVLSLVFLRREANLSKLQSDFVSKVSHELRTPLTSIRMFVEMLETKRVQSPDEVDACLAVLARETTRLNERIERLLDWGRMEAGRRVYDRQPDRVSDVVDAAVSSFRTAHVGREPAVAVEIAPSLPHVRVDRDALVDALGNLLQNAFKYTADHDKQISIRAYHEGKWVKISVRDNGIGIPPREHRRIFEKFYRVDERLSNEVEGSGLGLAIVRHVAQAHGGKVRVESEPGRGSTFTLWLRALPQTAS